MRSIGNKNTILLGLGFQILQLAWYGFGSEPWYVNSILISECDTYKHARIHICAPYAACCPG